MEEVKKHIYNMYIVKEVYSYIYVNASTGCDGYYEDIINRLSAYISLFIVQRLISSLKAFV